MLYEWLDSFLEVIDVGYCFRIANQVAEQPLVSRIPSGDQIAASYQQTPLSVLPRSENEYLAET